VAALAFAQPPPANLVPNGDFARVENNLPVGWTKSGEGAWGLEEGRLGAQSLKLTVNTQGKERMEVRAISPAFPVKPETYYLLTFWTRAENLRPNRGSHSQVDVNFKLDDGTPVSVAQEWKAGVYDFSATEWRVAQLIVRTPPRAATASLVAYLGLFLPDQTVSVWYDHFRVEEYLPPPPTGQEWYYRAPTYGVAGDTVADPDAKSGGAWFVGKDRTPGGKISGPVITDQPPGQYRVTFRLKVGDNTSPKPAVLLRTTACGVVNPPLQAGMSLRGTDFQAPNQYQEFSLEIIRPPYGGVQYLVDWWGGTEVWIDGWTVREERLLTDADLVSLYGLPAGPAKVAVGTQVYLCKGLTNAAWRLPEALAAAGLAVGNVSYLRSGGGNLYQLDPPFPQAPEDLKDTRLVVLADVSAEALGFAGRKVLRDFVASGGALLVVGGLASFGRGGLERSFLEEVVPVQTTGPFDLHQRPAPLVIQPVAGSFLEGAADWKRKPLCLWLHAVQVRPEGKTHLTAGGEPFLVLSTYGQGRVAACPGTVLGVPPAGAQGFWTWAQWPQVLGNVISFLVE
jgi:uncharacterized membrane protein